MHGWLAAWSEFSRSEVFLLRMRGAGKLQARQEETSVSFFRLSFLLLGLKHAESAAHATAGTVMAAAARKQARWYCTCARAAGEVVYGRDHSGRYTTRFIVRPPINQTSGARATILFGGGPPAVVRLSTTGCWTGICAVYCTFHLGRACDRPSLPDVRFPRILALTSKGASCVSG